MSNKKKSAVRRLNLSFDDANQQAIETVKAQVVAAGNQKAVAQSVVDALTLRLSATQALLSSAEAAAAASESNFRDGQVATQTVLNGLGHAVAAQTQAYKIRSGIRTLYEKSYHVAQQTVAAAQAVDEFALSVNARKAKNSYFSKDVGDGMPGVQEHAQTALGAALAAVQASMVALVRAEEAAVSSHTVVRETKVLLKQLLPKAADADSSKPVTNLREYPLYQKEPPSIGILVDELDDAADHGLLYLLDAIRQVRDFTRNEMSAINSETGMELNAAQHMLEKASQLYDGLKASMIAATAAL